jgi:transposase-like protein
MASVLNQPYFHDEAAAFTALEAIVWPNGPVCPFCHATDRIGRLEGVRSKPSRKHPEGIVRHGLHKCYHCKHQFTARKGSVFESSHLELRQWLQAAYLMCSSKKGVSSHQLARTLGITVKSAWFASHRLREAMKDNNLLPLGGEGRIIESDETYWGPKDVDTDPAMKRRRKGKPGTGGKARIMTLVERGGSARSVHVADLTNATMQRILVSNADTKSRLVTDEGTAPSIGLLFARHDTVKHSIDEYARYIKDDDDKRYVVTTNTVEGFFGVFKRGMRGIYQHCKEKHLHRYLAEFDFRYNNRIALGVNDQARTRKALAGVMGKRLTYRDSSA